MSAGGEQWILILRYGRRQPPYSAEPCSLRDSSGDEPPPDGGHTLVHLKEVLPQRCGNPALHKIPHGRTGGGHSVPP